jgi:hypothetical protein
MKLIRIVAISIIGLFAAVSVAAYAQMGTAAPIDGQKTEGVLDANGNLRETDSKANPLAFTINSLFR